MKLGRTFPKLLLLALSVVAILVLAGCTPSHPQSTFDVAGPIAEKQRTLFYIIFWAQCSSLCCSGKLLYTVIRFAGGQGPTYACPDSW